MCITDAFTKYVELVAIDNKEANTVAEAIFEKWFCRYGIPMEIVTDGGKEFCAKISEEVMKCMGATHLKTAPYHPQCNSQAEVANKTIADYLSKYVNQTMLDWELYIAPLMFAYNTSFHRSIQNTPHFLTYGIQARQPAFFQEDLNRKFYGENTRDELTQRLQYARQIAEQNNEYATSKMQEQFNRKAQPHSFAPGQWVLLRDFTVLGKNAKLAPKWKGPFKIISLKGAHNLLIHLADGKRTKLVNIENVKPYHEAPEKPVYNLERPENEENSETEMGAERTHHVHFEENLENENFDQADKTPEFETFFQRGEGLAASQNFEQSEPPRRFTRSQARRITESEGREQSIMPQLRRARTMTETETEAEELIEMGLEEDLDIRPINTGLTDNLNV